MQPDNGARSFPYRSTVLLVATLLALTALAYANAVNLPFVYDDLQLVLSNPEIRSLSEVPGLVGFDDEGFTLKTRWTRDVSYALEYALVGDRPWMFHATNIVLHGLVGLMLFGLVSLISRDRRLAFWAAALFLVHPINTEVVTHVSGRRGLLAALFSIATILLLEHYRRHGGVYKVVGAVLCLYLGAFSKELAVVAPLAYVAVHLYARRNEKEGRSRRGLFGELREMLTGRPWLYGTLALVTLGLSGAIVFFAADSHGLAGSPSLYDRESGLGLADRASLAGLGLRLLFVPIGQTVDYSYDALGFTQGFSAMRLLDLTVLLFAALATVWGLWRRSWIGFGGLWFAIFYLPVSGVIPWHEVFAERFLYLPGIGFAVAIASLLVPLLDRPRFGRFVSVAALAVVLLLAVGTISQNRVWSSSEALWTNAAERYPRTARAHKALANHYTRDIRPDLALEHFRTAVDIYPGFKDAHIGIALALLAQGEFTAANEALEGFVERWPEDPKGWNMRGYIHQSMGEIGLAVQAYRNAVENDPTYAEGYNNLAMIYAQNGEVDTAVEMYEKALEQDPALETALRNLAIIYRHAYEDEERAAEFEARAQRIQDAR